MEEHCLTFQKWLPHTEPAPPPESPLTPCTWSPSLHPGPYTALAESLQYEWQDGCPRVWSLTRLGNKFPTPQRKQLFVPFYGGKTRLQGSEFVLQARSRALRKPGSGFEVNGLGSETQWLNGCCRLARPALNLEQLAWLGRGVPGVLFLSSKLGRVPLPFKASLGSSSQQPVRFPVHLCGPEQQER